METSSLKTLLTVAVTLCTATVFSRAAEPVDLKLPKGFVAHRLFQVPKKTQGSWVCITFDDKGRLIASDQYGGLYRLTLPPLDQGARLEIPQVDVFARRA